MHNIFSYEEMHGSSRTYNLETFKTSLSFLTYNSIKTARKHKT